MTSSVDLSVLRGAPGVGIPIDEALPITKQIAEALEPAHEQGLIHRDLKPANIEVRPDGMVNVLDFGLTKALEGLGKPGRHDLSAMTQAGMILAAAGYGRQDAPALITDIQ